MNMDTVLLLLCLWASVATGMALYYMRLTRKMAHAVFVLGKELYHIAHGDLEIKIVAGEIQRTYHKPKEEIHA